MDLNDLRCPGCEGVIGTRSGAAWTVIWLWCADCQKMVQFDLSPAFTFRGKAVGVDLLASLFPAPPEPGLPDKLVVGVLGLPERIAVEVQQPLPAGELLRLSLPGLMTTSPVDLAPGDLVVLETRDGATVSVWRAGRVVYMVPGRCGIEWKTS